MTFEQFDELYSRLDPKPHGSSYVDLMSERLTQLPKPSGAEQALDDVYEALGAFMSSTPGPSDESTEQDWWNQRIVMLLVMAARNLRAAQAPASATVQ